MDALDQFENLTELGQHLVDLPIEPRLGENETLAYSKASHIVAYVNIVCV